MIDPPPPGTPRARVAAALLAGLMLAAAYPPLGWGFLAWFSLVPLLYSLSNTTFRQAAVRGYMMGLVFMGGVGLFTTSFGEGVPWMALLPWVLFTAIEALWFIPVGIALAAVLRRSTGGIMAGVPAVWVLAEWARGAGTYGFPFGKLAYAVPGAAVAQWASVGGCHLVSGLIAFGGTCLFLLMRKDSAVRRKAIFGLALLCWASVWGAWWAIDESADSMTSDVPRVSVLLAQGDINQPWGTDEAENAFTALRSRTIKAGGRPDLIVWSESAIPGPLSDAWLRSRVTDVPARLGAPLLTGTIGRTPEGDLSNMAVLLTPQRTVGGVYRKRRLVPFGEFVPLRGVLPFLDQFGVNAEDQVPGRTCNVITYGSMRTPNPLRIGVPICFESASPEAARAFTANGANVLVVITNDAWFGRTGMARQHLDAARLRAIETRRWVVRCAHTGISAVLTPDGGIFPGESLPQGTPGVIQAGIYLRTDRTPFVRFGEWFVWLCAAALILQVRRPNRRPA